jgi:hypothetical protein
LVEAVLLLVDSAVLLELVVLVELISSMILRTVVLVSVLVLAVSSSVVVELSGVLSNKVVVEFNILLTVDKSSNRLAEAASYSAIKAGVAVSINLGSLNTLA